MSIAIDAATRRHLRLGVCAVDAAGNVVAALRMDGAPRPSVDVAAIKARSAAMYGFPSDTWIHLLADAPTPLVRGVVALPGVAALEGGCPLVVDGVTVGAIGVSGGSGRDDIDVAAEVAQAMLNLPQT